MQAVILAAGKGTRMQPLTYDIPKAMLPLKGKPIIEYTLSFLPEAIDEVIIVINHLGDQIQKYFGDSWGGKKIKYVIHEKLDGTGGAIHACHNVVQNDFIVLMGDDLYHRDDLEKISSEKLAALALEVEDPTRFGVFKVDAENNLIDFFEKPKTFENRLANLGVYKLNKIFFEYDLVPVNEAEVGLPQTLAKMAKDHPVKILKAKMWHPIGYLEDLQKAEEVLGKFLK